MANSVRAMLPIAQQGKLSPRAKKGLSPGHTARTEVSCSLQSSLRSVQVFGKALEVCSIPESESQVEEKQANCPL